MEFATIPPPPIRGFDIGVLYIHLYGILIALAVLVGLAIAQYCWRLRARDPGEITDLAIFAIPAGIIGARLYHVVTDLDAYRENWKAAVFLWDGGLGIWGAVAVGAVVTLMVARRKRLPLTLLLAVAAPALCGAQALGRWGNYFNQELFGRPTSAPWALEVSPAYRPFETISVATYHPTFLYESLWCALVGVLLFVLFRTRRLPDGIIFPFYMSLYCLGRFFIERLRVDETHIVLGMRLNQWVSVFLFIAGAIWAAYACRVNAMPKNSLTTDEINS